MNLTYFKRYRMGINLVGLDFPRPKTPAGYRLLSWDPALLESHAMAKYHSFREEMDANIFPCLGELAGCRRLMGEISRKDGFLPGATWLAVAYVGADRRPEACGTIQGIRTPAGPGSVQNLGITPGHRGLGLGTCLLHRSLEGFRQAGLTQVTLEVTADNDDAIRLYERVGFRSIKTVFKAVEAPCS